jgi:hypothetical protein
MILSEKSAIFRDHVELEGGLRDHCFGRSGFGCDRQEWRSEFGDLELVLPKRP